MHVKLPSLEFIEVLSLVITLDLHAFLKGKYYKLLG